MNDGRGFDLILRGRRVISPASGIDGVKDLGVRNGTIAAIEAFDSREPGPRDRRCRGQAGASRNGRYACQRLSIRLGPLRARGRHDRSALGRHHGCRSGGSLLHDAARLPALHRRAREDANRSVDIAATVAAAKANKDIVRGIKAHAEIGGFARWGIRVIETAAEIGRLTKLPVYVHFTLGADMHGYNTRVPPPAGTPREHPDNENGTLSSARRVSASARRWTSIIALGLSLEQVVPVVTSNAAEMLGMSGEIGSVEVGRAADISVLHDDRGRFLLRDNDRNQVVAERLLRPAFSLRAGQRFDADAPILPAAVAA